MECISRVCPVWSRLHLRNVKVSANIYVSVHKEKSLYQAHSSIELKIKNWWESENFLIHLQQLILLSVFL